MCVCPSFHWILFVVKEYSFDIFYLSSRVVARKREKKKEKLRWTGQYESAEIKRTQIISAPDEIIPFVSSSRKQRKAIFSASTK